MLNSCKTLLLLLAVSGACPLVASDLTPQDDQPAPAPGKQPVADQQDAATKTAREQYEALVQQYQTQFTEYRTAATAAKTPAEKAKVAQLAPRVSDFAAKMIELAEKHAEDPVVVEALVWVVQQTRQGPQLNQALEQLTKNHVRSDKLRAVCLGLAIVQSPAVPEKFLRAVLAENPHSNMQGYATFGLAKVLQRKARMAEYAQAAANSAKRSARTAEPDGAAYDDELKKLDVAKVQAEVEQLLESAATKFKDVELNRGTVQTTLGKVVERDLFEIRFLSIGKVAPEIQGEDLDGVAFKLSDYRGKVVVVDFWGDW